MAFPSQVLFNEEYDELDAKHDGGDDIDDLPEDVSCGDGDSQLIL